ncbi:MAG: 1-acyl-sn-glycerol-3-phosphate acyltransferase [Victivallales bacterium]|nr:1-acyl-sn-glycerol-3-phosphate acyltransferase [Victivallales bacterium]
MKKKLEENSYETPANRKRVLLDKLFLNSRFYFYLRYFSILLYERRRATIGKFDDEEYLNTSLKTFKLVEDCGGKFQIKGIDRLRKTEGPVVFVCNHMSMLETFILPMVILPYKKASFVVKKSLVTGKFFGRIMRATKPIALTRTEPMRDYRKVMKEGKKLIASGRSIIVFPQGIRGKFDPESFGSIGGKLAEKAGVPVIPVALKTDFWSNGKFVLNFGSIHRERKIYIEFGPPQIVENKKKTHSATVKFIESKLREWKAL